MSGGHFNYDQSKIREIADSVFGLIRKQKMPLKDDWIYSKETLKEFETAYDLLSRAYIYAHRIDWLLCGDDAEDTFHERLKEDLGSNQ